MQILPGKNENLFTKSMTIFVLHIWKIKGQIFVAEGGNKLANHVNAVHIYCS